MKNIISIAGTTRFAALLLLGAGVSAHAQNGDWNTVTSSEFNRSEYVDLSTTSTVAGHVNQPTGTFGGVAGLKYRFMQFATTTPSQCFELSTGAPRFMPGAMADTRIWLMNGASPVSIHDDINGAVNRYSNARFWITGSNSFLNIAVAAYSTDMNNSHFSVNVRHLPLTEANCTTNQTIPWVKSINGNVTVSPNAG
jgi:hypothetical protein